MPNRKTFICPAFSNAERFSWTELCRAPAEAVAQPAGRCAAGRPPPPGPGRYLASPAGHIRPSFNRASGMIPDYRGRIAHRGGKCGLWCTGTSPMRGTSQCPGSRVHHEAAGHQQHHPGQAGALGALEAASSGSFGIKRSFHFCRTDSGASGPGGEPEPRSRGLGALAESSHPRPGR
jgi:hypothetical protein